MIEQVLDLVPAHSTLGRLGGLALDCERYTDPRMWQLLKCSAEAFVASASSCRLGLMEMRSNRATSICADDLRKQVHPDTDFPSFNTILPIHDDRIFK